MPRQRLRGTALLSNARPCTRAVSSGIVLNVWSKVGSFAYSLFIGNKRDEQRHGHAFFMTADGNTPAAIQCDASAFG